jgi:YVTN family beta-propeller protein
MKKQLSLQFVSAIAAALFIFTSCKKDNDDTPVFPPSQGYLDQMLVINEGAFGNSNGSIDFINPNTGERTADAFNKANNRPLGDVVQSVFKKGNLLYITVNNSQKVEVVHAASCKSYKTITGFISPRYFLPLNNSKAYVTDWGDNSVKIVSLDSYTITGSIPVNQNGPEQLIEAEGKIFVVNSGGFGDDNTVSVIDPQTDQVVQTIPVGTNPNSIVKDANGKLWILCGGDTGPDWTGGTADDVAGSLIRMNPADYSIELNITLGQFEHPVKLSIRNGSELYFLNGMNGYEGSPVIMSITDNMVPAPLVNKNFYGIGFHPSNGDVYGGYSPFFGQSGYVFRYTNTGVLIDSIKAGIGPSGFMLNN